VIDILLSQLALQTRILSTARRNYVFPISIQACVARVPRLLTTAITQID